MPTVLIFHRPPQLGDSPLAALLNSVRRDVAQSQGQLFGRLGANIVHCDEVDASFGELLARAAPKSGGVVVFSAGAVPRLNARDAGSLLEAASAGTRVALTNNRYSSDICAVGDSSVLRQVPALPSDNALPRWLGERAGFDVRELGGRGRLALDIDSPLDIALWALAPDVPPWARVAATRQQLAVPRADDLRALARDPRRELLVFGRASSWTLRWLEQNVRCRVRFLAEERGLRASSQLAIAGVADSVPRPPRATLDCVRSSQTSRRQRPSSRLMSGYGCMTGSSAGSRGRPRSDLCCW